MTTTELAGYGIITESGALRFERLLPGPIERVWEYLTDSDKRARWLASGPMELRPGGDMELIWRNAELTSSDDPVPAEYAEYEEHRMSGKILRAEPPHLLVHDWHGAKGVSEVTYELEERGERVLLTLTHRNLAPGATGVHSGWHSHLDILVAVLEGREPAPFWATHAKLEEEYKRRLGG